MSLAHEGSTPSSGTKICKYAKRGGENMSNLEIIAKTIGYHFWHPESDQQAIELGLEAAEKIVKELERNEKHN